MVIGVCRFVEKVGLTPDRDILSGNLDKRSDFFNKAVMIYGFVEKSNAGPKTWCGIGSRGIAMA
jgi:hypothetical protein